MARCDALIRGHHDLHDATLVGEHLRHAILYQGRWLGLATWGAAAFHMKDRDAFIGWDFEPCRRRPLPANNSRVLILPDDRLARWGHPLAMLETFVDPRLHQGTAYKVSGGSHLGRTAGWKRDAADFHLRHDAVKDIWVRKLVRKAAAKLRAPQLPQEWAMVEAQAHFPCGLS